MHSVIGVDERSWTLKSLINLSLNLMLALIPFAIALTVLNEAAKVLPAIAEMDVNAPELWNSQPTVVTDKLAYERVPGVQYAETQQPSVRTPEMVGLNALTARSEILQEAVLNPTVDLAGVEACGNRYRSYRAEDNTYQPYDGGPRRLCVLRNDGAETANATGDQSYAAANVMVDSHGVSSTVPAHANWCSSRYRSYDPVTNSYQSFSGSRKACVSPFN